MESTLVDPIPTQPVGIQQPADEVESESAHIQQQTDAHESELEYELVEETKPKPIIDIRRYQLRQRKASS